MVDVKLLAMCGSLRQVSYNRAALQALKTLAPDQVAIHIAAIDDLPLFNPDRENEAIAPLSRLKAELKASQGLIIASPEYAHGVSGPMKNALDWLVSGEEFPYKPIMLINTSPRAHHALDALKEILTTMSGNVIDEAVVEIPLLSSGLDAAGIVAREDLSTLLQNGLQRFLKRLASS